MSEDQKKRSSGTQKMVCENCRQDWNIKVNLHGRCCHCGSKQTAWVKELADSSPPNKSERRIIAL